MRSPQFAEEKQRNCPSTFLLDLLEVTACERIEPACFALELFNV
jgi:hypothetical protein